MTLRHTSATFPKILAALAIGAAALTGCSSSDKGGSGSTTSGGGGGGTTLNGCTLAAAQDQSGKMTVDVSALKAWALPHQLCLKVSAGTTVSWTGDFGSHPIDGGSPGATDNASPITTAGKTVTGQGTVTVKLDKTGDFPYYCAVHQGSMQGVIYVR